MKIRNASLLLSVRLSLHTNTTLLNSTIFKKPFFYKNLILPALTGILGALSVFLTVKLVSFTEPEVNFILDDNLLLHLIIVFYFVLALFPLLIIKIWLRDRLSFGRAFIIAAIINTAYLLTLLGIYLLLGTRFNFWSVLGLLLFALLFGFVFALTMARMVTSKNKTETS